MARRGKAARTRSSPPPVWPVRLAVVVVIAMLVGGGYGAWTWLADPPSVTEPAAVPAEPSLGPVRRTPPLRGFQAILDGDGAGLRVARLAALPRVLVLDFPSLAAQGKALNRVAALIEKAGLSRTHVVSAEELARYIEATGARAATFYYGHNYDSGELAAFFATARRDGAALNQAERRLRRLLTDVGAIQRTDASEFAPGPAIDYVISLARMEGSAAKLRPDILRHEVGHAVFDQRPTYRAYARRFVAERMPKEVRGAFTRFLAERDYDTEDRALVVDEVQAYLNFTPNPRIIDDATLGLPAGTLARLRAEFRGDMPAAGQVLR